MEMDTIATMHTALSPYATAHDPSKLDLHLSPQSQDNVNSYSEEDTHSTSGDESNEEECQDDYETPLSTPDSRRTSQELIRRSPEDTQRPQAKPFTSNLDEDSIDGSELTIRPLQKQSTHAPMGNTTSLVPPPVYIPEYVPDSQENFIFRHFRGPAPTPLIPEGTEQLPSYSANIELCNVFLRKSEYYNVTTRTFDRKWHRVMANLTGTKLEIFSATRPFYRHLPSHPDLPYHVKRGALLKTYSLQHAEVGLATDYLKRKFVLRLRVEAEQFLLSCTEIETLIQWMEKLTWAVGLALELEEREEVKETTLPRNRRRRRRVATVSASDALAAAVAELAAEREDDSGGAGEERSREQRFHSPSTEIFNVEEEIAPDPEPTRTDEARPFRSTSAFSSITSTPNMSRAPTPAPSQFDEQLPLATNYHNHNRTQSSMNTLFHSMPRPSVGRPHTSSGGRDGMALYPSTLSQSITSLAGPSVPHSSNATPNHSSLNLSRKDKKRKKSYKSEPEPESEVKEVWQPEGRWSPGSDLAHAKKCMPALLRDASRKTCCVFYEGERCVVKMSRAKAKDGQRQAVIERVERLTLNLMPLKDVEPPAYEPVVKA